MSEELVYKPTVELIENYDHSFEVRFKNGTVWHGFNKDEANAAYNAVSNTCKGGSRTIRSEMHLTVELAKKRPRKRKQSALVEREVKK